MLHPWIAIHFAHRLGALAVVAAVMALAAAARRAPALVRAGAWTGVGLAVAQVGLGGAAVLSGLAPGWTVAHHALGALLLTATLWTAMWSRRGVVLEAPRPAEAPAGATGVPA
jgi:cytochrome c oxidase assembly protein subunit 15